MLNQFLVKMMGPEARIITRHGSFLQGPAFCSWMRTARIALAGNRVAAIETIRDYDCLAQLPFDDLCWNSACGGYP